MKAINVINVLSEHLYKVLSISDIYKILTESGLVTTVGCVRPIVIRLAKHGVFQDVSSKQKGDRIKVFRFKLTKEGLDKFPLVESIIQSERAIKRARTIKNMKLAADKTRAKKAVKKELWSVRMKGTPGTTVTKISAAHLK